MVDLSQLSVSGVLVQHIRDEIIRGNFAPGERLRLRDLASQFNVSTQPIRDALSELEGEGLVNSEPRRGTVVTALTPAELEDIYEIRATLEAMATRAAIPNLDEKSLVAMEKLVDEIDQHMGEVVELVRLNYDFHATLYSASGRKHLCELNAALRNRTAHYLHSYMINLGGMPLAQQEHRAIINACRAAEVEQAADLMYRHVYNVGQSIIKYVQNSQESEEND